MRKSAWQTGISHFLERKLGKELCASALWLVEPPGKPEFEEVMDMTNIELVYHFFKEGMKIKTTIS